MHVLIFANPFSGSKANPKRVARLESALQGAGLSPQVSWERTGRAERIRAAAAEGQLQAVVAAGGDGSVADAINAMADADCLDLPFTTLPVGTENLFAKQFNLHRLAPEKLATAIRDRQTRPCDLGEYHADGGFETPGRLFTLMASTGFDADVVRHVQNWRCAPTDGTLRRVRKASYLKPVVKSIFGYRYPKLTLTADGETVTGSQAYVFNLPQYGGNLGIGRHAKPDDGQLHWLVFRKPGLLNLIGYHGLCKIDRHLQAGSIAHGYAREISVTADQEGSLPSQADGDPAGHTPMHLRSRPGVLQVITPG